MTPSEIIADLDALTRYAGTSDYRLGLERRARAALLRPVSHWTALMKLAMLKGIKTGVVCIEDLVRTHRVSAAEIIEWASAYEKRGTRGLRVSSTIGRKRGAAA